MPLRLVLTSLVALMWATPVVLFLLPLAHLYQTSQVDHERQRLELVGRVLQERFHAFYKDITEKNLSLANNGTIGFSLEDKTYAASAEGVLEEFQRKHALVMGNVLWRAEGPVAAFPVPLGQPGRFGLQTAFEALWAHIASEGNQKGAEALQESYVVIATSQGLIDTYGTSIAKTDRGNRVLLVGSPIIGGNPTSPQKVVLGMVTTVVSFGALFSQVGTGLGEWVEARIDDPSAPAEPARKRATEDITYRYHAVFGSSKDNQLPIILHQVGVSEAGGGAWIWFLIFGFAGIGLSGFLGHRIATRIRQDLVSLTQMAPKIKWKEIGIVQKDIAENRQFLQESSQQIDAERRAWKELARCAGTIGSALNLETLLGEVSRAVKALDLPGISVVKYFYRKESDAQFIHFQDANGWEILLTPDQVVFGTMIDRQLVIPCFDSGALGIADGLLLVTFGYNYNYSLNADAPVGIQVLKALSTVIGGAIAHLREAERVAERARLLNEQKTSVLVQDALLPKTLSIINGLSCEWFFAPARECGGDWFGYYTFGDKIRLFSPMPKIKGFPLLSRPL